MKKAMGWHNAPPPAQNQARSGGENHANYKSEPATVWQPQSDKTSNTNHRLQPMKQPTVTKTASKADEPGIHGKATNCHTTATAAQAATAGRAVQGAKGSVKLFFWPVPRGEGALIFCRLARAVPGPAKAYGPPAGPRGASGARAALCPAPLSAARHTAANSSCDAVVAAPCR